MQNRKTAEKTIPLIFYVIFKAIMLLLKVFKLEKDKS